MSISRAARKLGVHSTYIRREIEAGRLRWFRYRGVLHVDPYSLRDYQRCERKPSCPARHDVSGGSR